MKNLTKKSLSSQAALVGAIASALLMNACGPQAYVPASNALTQNAGTMDLPPKIDILVGVDMKGAMKEIYPNMEQDIQNFSTNLQNTGWDYRLTAVSLSEGDPNPMSQIAVSKYDGNWNIFGSWLAPYPGAVPSAEQINSTYFSQSTTAASFFPGSLSNYGNDGHKTGILNEVNFINRSDVINGFLRTDAMLGIITLSDSKDTSGGQWITQQNGQVIWTPPENLIPTQPDNITGTFVPSLIARKSGAASLIKYYALVSHDNHFDGSCKGANTFAGTRYERMAGLLGGTSVDICSNTLAQSLTQVQQNLTTTRLSFHKNILVLGNEPNVSTITITENGVNIPQDPTHQNGWDYLGGPMTMPTINAPIAMDTATGYMIELYGSAILIGNESATINYLNAGAVISH